MSEKYSKAEMVVAEMFEKLEDIIDSAEDKGLASAEFMDMLTGCLAHYHNLHYPESAHELIISSMTQSILAKAKLLRMAGVKPQGGKMHLHITVIQGNKK